MKSLHLTLLSNNFITHYTGTASCSISMMFPSSKCCAVLLIITVCGPRVGGAIDWSESKVRFFAQQPSTLIPFFAGTVGTPFTNITVNDGDGYKIGAGKLLLDFLSGEHLVMVQGPVIPLQLSTTHLG